MPSVTDLPLLPPQLKKIKPYLQRAKETESKFPVIAYYCCKYAATLGTEIVKGGGVSKDCTTFLVALLDGLEASRGQLGQLSDDDGQSRILTFAMKIFKKNDDTYRAGRADKKTARALYAAGHFLTALKQFGPMEKKLDNLRKYALISASRILKALRSGQRPMPPDGAVSNDLPGVPDIPTNNTPRVPDIPAAPRNDVLDIPPAPGQDDTKPSTGGFLDIPAAPGFGDEDNKKPSTGGFLDIPAAPGFEDNTKPSTGGFLDIPAAPGFEDNTKPSTTTGGFPDIPAAPGFEDNMKPLL